MQTSKKKTRAKVKTGKITSRSAPQRIQVNVKLNQSTSPADSTTLIASKPGVLEVIQTFPDETDGDLSRLYVVAVDSRQIKQAITTLNEDPDVEYAEAAAPRGLIE